MNDDRGPRLLTTRAPRHPKGVVLVLHGGSSRRDSPPVSLTQLSVIRMVPIAHRFARAGRGELAVHRLLNSHRGWDSTRTPVMDVTWALQRVRETYGEGVPVCLVGHSLGGRAALMSGAAPSVRSVVALNPWLYPHDRADLQGRRVLIVHGTDDRVAPLEHAAAFAERLSGTTSTQFVTVPGGKHAMLRHGREFERAASDFVVETLLEG